MAIKRKFAWRGALYALAALIALGLSSGWGWTAGLDRAVFDRFQIAKPRVYDPQAPVRIVDIDTRSLDELGQWPWPRTYIAKLVERLSELGAAVIAFDVLFAEPDRTSPAAILTAWNKFDEITPPDLSDLPDHQAAFIEALEENPVVLGVILSNSEGADAPSTKANLSHLGPSPIPFFPSFAGAETNLPKLTEAAQGIASITLSERFGGIVRSVPLFADAGGAVIPGLSIEALRVAQAAPNFLAKTVGASGELDFGGGGGGMVSLRVGGVEVPTRRDGSLWVRFSGPDPRRSISATHILGEDWANDEVRSKIEGQIIFVGTSAPGLRDLVATPLSDVELGVAVHAEVTEQILSGDFLERPDWARGLEVVAMIALGLLAALLVMFDLALASFAVMALAACGAFVTSWFVFSNDGILLGPVLPALGALIPWGAGSLVNYSRAEAERRAVKSQFNAFLAPEIVDEIANDPERYLKPGGENRVLTILFCDVRSFSTLSAGLSSSEVIDLLNDFLTPLSNVIIDHGGTIDKYMGDAIMAFWNAPKERAGHETLACEAALGCRAAVTTLNQEFARRGRAQISCGIGINTGECSVGPMGSKSRLDYTCIGDAVNVASRFEGLSKQFGVDICVTEPSFAATTSIAAIELDRVTVVGRDDIAEQVYTLLGSEDHMSSAHFAETRELAASALRAYRSQNFAEAVRLFDLLGAQEPLLTNYADIMRNRTQALRSSPPGDGWDGVYRSTKK